MTALVQTISSDCTSGKNFPMLPVKLITAIASTLLASATAVSQELKVDFNASATVAIALGWNKSKEVYPALYEIGLTTSAASVLDNGSEIGARFTLRGSQDNPLREAGSGELTSLGRIVLPGTYTDVKVVEESLVDAGPRARFETAYFYIDGGYGEFTLGRDIGVAGRFHEGPRSVFSHARDSDALLDPSGMTITRSRLDWSGNSAKVSFASPRLVGLRVGFSYTPTTEADGLNRSISRSIGGEMTEVWESGFNYSRSLRKIATKLRIGLGYSTAKISEDIPSYLRQVDGWFGGIRIEGRQTALGLSFTEANDGRNVNTLQTNIEDSSDVWTAGVEHELLKTYFSTTYSSLSRESDGLSAISWSVGLKRKITEDFSITGGVQCKKVEIESLKLEGIGAIVELNQKW